MRTTRILSFLVAATLIMTFAATARIFAQSASESMHEAKESTENAASSTGHAIGHVYHATTTAAEDSTITGKIKAALHEDKVTKDANIHVKTVAGVVTLRGSVTSSVVSEHAQHLAAEESGVKSVKNRLKLASPQAAN